MACITASVMRLASSSPLRPLLRGQPRGWTAAKGEASPLTAALVWALVAMLALSLLLGQTLGLVHAVLHGEAIAYAHRQHAAHDEHQHESDHDNGHDHGIESWQAKRAAPGAALEALFGEHEDSSNCRLFDQSSHADVATGLPLLALAMRLVCSRLLIGLVEQPLPAAWALFEARGPPAVR